MRFLKLGDKFAGQTLHYLLVSVSQTPCSQAASLASCLYQPACLPLIAVHGSCTAVAICMLGSLPAPPSSITAQHSMIVAQAPQSAGLAWTVRQIRTLLRGLGLKTLNPKP